MKGRVKYNHRDVTEERGESLTVVLFLGHCLDSSQSSNEIGITLQGMEEAEAPDESNKKWYRPNRTSRPGPHTKPG